MGRLFYQRTQVEDLTLGLLALARERENLFHELLAAMRGMGNGGKLLASLGLRLTLEQHGGVPENRREQIVEIVSDAAREGADGF